jgi:hypothetical protein
VAGRIRKRKNNTSDVNCVTLPTSFWGQNSQTGQLPIIPREIQGDSHSLLLTSISRSDMFATALGTAMWRHAKVRWQTGNNSQVQH